MRHCVKKINIKRTNFLKLVLYSSSKNVLYYNKTKYFRFLHHIFLNRVLQQATIQLINVETYESIIKIKQMVFMIEHFCIERGVKYQTYNIGGVCMSKKLSYSQILQAITELTGQVQNLSGQYQNLSDHVQGLSGQKKSFRPSSRAYRTA